MVKSGVGKTILYCCSLISSLIVCGLHQASALDLTVNGADGTSVVSYRWVLEEDRTFHVVPGQTTAETPSLRFHVSHMPVVASGDHTTPPTNLTLDPAKRYFVSVLPDSGYTNGGAAIAAGQTSVTVTVNKLPLRTAQISVLVFEDNFPLSGTPDLPNERGLEGFTVILTEGGGRYGMSGGQVMMDAFGNPLGTTYNTDPVTGEAIPVSMGSGVIKTGPNGEVLIKNLHPGKYGLQIVPPPGQGWQQTSTIEGSKTIDTWVKAGELPYLVEFGVPFWHVFFGFVKADGGAAALTGGSTVTGQVVNNHMARPPATGLESSAAFAHTTPWIALNEGGALGRCIYARPVEGPDGQFSIPNVPPGVYQLVIWDSNLDFIISFHTVTVPPGGGTVALNQIPVFHWFTRLENHVFYDANENGFRDPGEVGIPEQTINLRFRDGSLYQSMATDTEGFAPFDEVFPFLHWLVAEVDFARFKATGVTAVVDDGGATNPADPWSFGGQVRPQPQPDPANPGSALPYRVETGPTLTQAFQGMLGQTNVLLWGKKQYEAGNGGISGIVYYAVTRAENDPRYAVAEPWEPGIPRVQMVLYADSNNDQIVDDLNGDGVPTKADVDNYPFGNFPGPEDVDRLATGQFDYGDALQIVTTDSWDDSLPGGLPSPTFSYNGQDQGAFDGLANFNQIRPGVFDGGYAFTSYFPGGMVSGSAEAEGLPSGYYIVEAVPPPGLHLVKEEDRNVDFGDAYTPSPLLLPPACVGDAHLVPAVLSLFPAQAVPAGFAGQTRPLCDRKQVTLTAGRNAAADFFLFTPAPISARVIGAVTDDIANEGNPQSPLFGEKFGPAFMPIAFRDHTGREVARVYADQWGKYNLLLPSTYTADRPVPSGMAPSMLTISLNDPGPIPDPANPGQFITDPNFNRQYAQSSLTFQFMPGTTTYLDTPVLPTAAFTGTNAYPLDCEPIDGTPRIFSVSGPEGGPYVAAAGSQITITALGSVPVPNPAFDGAGGARTVVRDYGFGATPGMVTVGGVPLTGLSWSNGAISGTVAPGTATGELMVTRGDNGRSTTAGVTLTVGGTAPLHVSPGTTIQAAIDQAQPGDLILVPPGTYPELLVMWKPVRLQGWGPESTRIDGFAGWRNGSLTAWRAKVQQLTSSGSVTLAPGTAVAVGGGAGMPASTAIAEEGAGILVLARNVSPAQGGFGLVNGAPNARIDGFTISGAEQGGGVMVNAYAHYLEIANNVIVNNQGVFGGGIRVGSPNRVVQAGGQRSYSNAANDHIRIHNNVVRENASRNGAGGGIALYTGSDGYAIQENFVCGNLNTGDGGAGIAHWGLSDNGVISANAVVFNESFNQMSLAPGGGILIAGAPSLGDAGTLGAGAGSVSIVSNLIQGNSAGSGDGAGIAAERVNGADVAASPNQPSNWHQLSILNNIIVNNVAGMAGGGMALLDVARSNIAHNTIANNDSTATAGTAFTPGNPNVSSPQPAGIVSYVHSVALRNAFGGQAAAAPYREFSNPRLVNNIIRHNRSFHYLADPTQNPPFYGLLPNIDLGQAPVFADLEVLGGAQQLNPQSCILTDAIGYDASNFSSDPLFVDGYFNGDRRQAALPAGPLTSMQVTGAFDEGGNWVRVLFGPLTPRGNYHLQGASPAVNSGDGALNPAAAALAWDYDAEPRPQGAEVDVGADELGGAAAQRAGRSPGSPPMGPRISPTDPNPMLLAFEQGSGGGSIGGQKKLARKSARQRRIEARKRAIKAKRRLLELKRAKRQRQELTRCRAERARRKKLSAHCRQVLKRR